MARSKGLRTQLYRAARILGDVSAAANGPTAYARRRARRVVYRRTNRATGSLLRALGLQGRRR